MCFQNKTCGSCNRWCLDIDRIHTYDNLCNTPSSRHSLHMQCSICSCLHDDHLPLHNITHIPFEVAEHEYEARRFPIQDCLPYVQHSQSTHLSQGLSNLNSLPFYSSVAAGGKSIVFVAKESVFDENEMFSAKEQVLALFQNAAVYGTQNRRSALR